MKAITVEDAGAPDAPAGAIQYIRDDGDRIVGIRYRCPCGCGLIGEAGLPVHNWSGPAIDPDCPTIAAAVILYQPARRGGPPHWKGWLQFGEWSTWYVVP